jgi:hypothetical protein
MISSISVLRFRLPRVMLLGSVRFGNGSGLVVIRHPQPTIRQILRPFPTALVDLGLDLLKGLDPRENTIIR